MSRPRLLDLFCGAGGAAEGYHQAGFEVVGVDKEPQPRYPFEFHQADALTFPLDGFDAIHASPPCQAFSEAQRLHGIEHPDLLTPMRGRLLAEASAPWVIENVPGAPMQIDLLLCGSMFGLRSGDFGLIRHRWFEFSSPVTVLLPPCVHPPRVVSVFGGGAKTKTGGHHEHVPRAVASSLMGIDWMTRTEISEAIPPASTRFIGEQLLDHLKAVA